MRRAVVAVLLTFLTTVALIEGGVRLLDPFGVGRYEADQRILYGVMQPDPSRNVVYRPGIVAFSNFSMTTLPDHTRAVPATATDGCTIAFLGDSVTLGWGVNDADTWVNLVARELPGVRVVNTGVAGYSIYDVAATMEAVKADGYFYLLIGNDNRRMRFTGAALPADTRSAMQRNLEYFTLASVPDPVFDDEFYAAMGKMVDQGVTVAAFDAPAGREAAKRYPVTLIPMYADRLSFVDRHADAEGNRQIAASILPIVKELAESVCNGS
jgi:hypothetical protein